MLLFCVLCSISWSCLKIFSIILGFTSNMITCLSPVRSNGPWSVKKNGLWNEVWGRGGGPGVSDGVIWGFLLQVASCWPYNLLQNEGCFEKTWATRTEVFKGNFSVDWFISFTWSTIEQASTEIAITCNLLKWMKVKMFWLHFKNTL